ncbi:IS256-like element ISBli2 family transposase [Brevibacterium aurantiacum]|uniref:IS256-like element ISBli2 family transposase n=1 Tax=Brevibacterium aurantiacum TaxID=273384 RepID=UPI000F6352A7|nr:IS256-like element ISBli2 family transposase [Brevibacterium aurantiacum]AZL05373.1 IS256-like element ISBli2 family transposase [Brevibacterium aurantiacum]
MADPNSAVSTLINQVLTDPDLAHSDVFRQMLQAGLQDLIEAEATATIGAARYERSEDRSTRRNGSRKKTLATPSGEVDLAIPKLRKGSFFPSLLNPRRRVDKALYAVICQAWIDGVSTRKVDDLVRALGNESGISRSTVSRICADIDEAVAEFLARRLDHTWFPYLFVDATYVDVRHRGRVVSQAVAVVTGVSSQGRREILTMSVGDAESTDFWTQVLRGLRERGLKVSTETDPEGVALVISDAHSGIKAAVKAILPGAGWQRCRVHFARNVTQRLGSAHSKPVNALISTIFAQTTAETVIAQYKQVAESLRASFPDIADMLESAEVDLTAFVSMPRQHWQKIWSNNPIERLNREIKRRADVVQIFPNRESVTRLIGAVLQEQHEEWQYGERRYLSEISMRKLVTVLHGQTEVDPVGVVMPLTA